MNRARLIFIGFAALSVGLLASGWAYRQLQQRGGQPQGMQEIAVAASDIGVGTRIQEKDVRMVQMPADADRPRRILH
jgi:Flp pilus assembly protein CpaB